MSMGDRAVRFAIEDMESVSMSNGKAFGDRRISDMMVDVRGAMLQALSSRLEDDSELYDSVMRWSERSRMLGTKKLVVTCVLAGWKGWH
jgi:hypothetical protein